MTAPATHTTLDPSDLRKAHQRAQKALAHVGLPFRRRTWTGTAGNWAGAGIGSSIDFQDHRPYLPGDDPRYIDWNAYARTGSYTMKLYREEVSPRVDLILDASASMFFEPAKRRRALELLYFCVEGAVKDGSTIRCFQAHGRAWEALPLESLFGYRWDQLHREADTLEPVALHALPLRPGSLRIVISDLLFPCEAETALSPLASGRNRGIIFAPFSPEEENPDWEGTSEFVDCETDRRRIQKTPPEILKRYKETYRRHFEIWRDRCSRYQVTFARIPSRVRLVEALLQEAVPAGAVDLWT